MNQKKRIGINGLSALRGGGQTNLINLLNYLPEYDCDVTFIANTKNQELFAPYQSQQIDIIEVPWASKSIFHRIFWEKFILPKRIREWKIDIYYAPGGTMTTKVPKGCTSITALHNMLPFDDKERQRFPLFSYSRFKLWLLKYVFLRSYKLADKVIFTSEYSRQAVSKYLPDMPGRSVMIPLGINEIFLDHQKTIELPFGLKKDGFYLYVSHLDYYKAQKEVVRSWKKLIESGFNYPLVLAGPKYNQYGEDVLALIKTLGLEDKVIYIGSVAYEKLPALYQMAKALVYASSCECCPNILLEMLASKKLIFCSNVQPMPEFGEDAVIYFDPYSETQLCEKILEVNNNPEIIEQKAQASYALALKYGFEQTMKKNIEFILE